MKKIYFVLVTLLLFILTSCNKGHFVVNKEKLDFGKYTNELTFIIENTGKKQLTFSISSGLPEAVSFNYENGILTEDEKEIITVTVDRHKLDLKTYNDFILLKVNSDKSIYIELVIDNSNPYPSVITGFAKVTDHSADILKTVITGDTCYTVDQYGICWSKTNLTPTINDSKCELGTCRVICDYEYSDGSCSKYEYDFNYTIGDLERATTYYYRGYAIRDSFVGYGEVKTFTTYFCYGYTELIIKPDASVPSYAYPIHVWVDDVYWGVISSYGGSVHCYASGLVYVVATANSGGGWQATLDLGNYYTFYYTLLWGKMDKKLVVNKEITTENCQNCRKERNLQ